MNALDRLSKDGSDRGIEEGLGGMSGHDDGRNLEQLSIMSLHLAELGAVHDRHLHIEDWSRACT